MKNKLLYLFLCCVTIQFTHAQQKTTYAEVPPLYIEQITDKPTDLTKDFGYNVNVSQEAGLRANYYLWVDDHWYEVVNASEVFVADEQTPLLFSIKNIDQSVLKIQDSLDVVYTYPIRAISSNFIEQNIYQVKDRQKLMAQVDNLIAERLSKEDAVIVKEPLISEDTLINETKNDTIVKSPVLDVVDIQETTVRTVKPFVVEGKAETVVEDETEQADESLPIEVLTEDELKIKKIDSEDIPTSTEKTEDKKPKNAYEQAVSDGFEGTVTEWIEWSIREKKINPYHEAQKNGFEGTEEEWKKSLWGSSVTPEIEEREKTTSIVMSWMDELNSPDGYSPYERALKNGFYGTFTEWVESVIGTEGAKAFEADKKNGFAGTYKEWIEEKLNASNAEMMRKDQLKNTNFVLVPNVTLEVPEYVEEVATFDLYAYYQKYYGGSVISSSGQNSAIEIKPTDLEYQITWYDANAIKITELTPEGVIKYQCVDQSKTTTINIRYVVKN